MTKIHVDAADVWNYAYTHRNDLLDNEHLIAENTEFGITIYVTMDSYYPVIKVYADDNIVSEEEVFSSFTCRVIVDETYENYLTYSYINSSADTNVQTEVQSDIADSEDNTDPTEELIIEREIEIEGAVEDFLHALGVDENLGTGEFNKVIADCVEHFCEYICRKHNLMLYRPMYLEYDTGIELELYPYEHMAFDSNQIYK